MKDYKSKTDELEKRVDKIDPGPTPICNFKVLMKMSKGKMTIFSTGTPRDLPPDGKDYKQLLKEKLCRDSVSLKNEKI